MTGFFGGLEQLLLEQAVAEPDAIIAENGPWAYTSQSQSGAAGILYMMRLMSLGGLSATFNMAVITAGAVLANTFAALYTLAGTQIAATADRSADANLITSGTLWSPPWVNPVNIPPGDLYGAVLIGSATTMPSFGGFRTNSLGAANLGTSAVAGNLRYGSGGSGLVALPANAVPVSMSPPIVAPWMAVT
jgi:hypothetical protein